MNKSTSGIKCYKFRNINSKLKYGTYISFRTTKLSKELKVGKVRADTKKNKVWVDYKGVSICIDRKNISSYFIL